MVTWTWHVSTSTHVSLGITKNIERRWKCPADSTFKFPPRLMNYKVVALHTPQRTELGLAPFWDSASQRQTDKKCPTHPHNGRILNLARPPQLAGEAVTTDSTVACPGSQWLPRDKSQAWCLHSLSQVIKNVWIKTFIFYHCGISWIHAHKHDSQHRPHEAHKMLQDELLYLEMVLGMGT